MHKTAFRLFLFVLVFSPLAYGAVEPWSLMIMEAAAFGALFSCLAGSARDNSFYAAPGITPLLLLLGYILFQLMPLPAGLVRILSPATFSLYEETAGVLAQQAWIPLTIHPKATLAEFFRISAYVSFYVVTVQLLAGKELLRKTVAVVIVLASLMAIAAILQKVISPDTTVFWFRKMPVNATPTGTYVYHNAYAGYMEMIVPVILGLFFYYRPEVPYRQSLRARLIEIFNQHRTNIHVLLGFAAILITTSIFVSLSRGGIISLALAVVFLLVVSFNKRKKRGSTRLTLFIITLTLLAVGWFGWDTIFARFEEMRNVEGELENDRFLLWQDSTNAIQDFSLTGTGFGTFLDIYPRYRTLPGRTIVDHAHNDYIELLTDGGFVAMALVTWFLVFFLLHSYTAYGRRRDSYAIHLYTGCLSGMVALLFHSLVDFNFHIGANGLYFFFLAGLGVSAAHTRFIGGGGRTRLRQSRLPRRVLAAALLVLATACTLFHSGVMWSRYFFEPVSQTSLHKEMTRRQLTEIRDRAAAAVRTDPFEARYRFALAGAETFLGNIEAARFHYKNTLRLNPTRGEYLQAAGLFLAGMKDEKAEQLLMSSARFEAMEPERHRKHGAWLLANNRKEEGIAEMKEAVSLEPNKTDAYINLMVLHGLSDEEIRTAMPELAQALFVFGRYMETLGREGTAAEAFRDGLQSVAHNETEIKPWHFLTVNWFYHRKKSYDDALGVMLEAVRVFPNHAEIRSYLAYGYEKLGDNKRAIKEYEKALTLDPENKVAVKGMQRLRKKQ